MANNASLNNVLTAILAVGNKEANQQYAPAIYQSHYQTTTSFILDKLAEIYPIGVDLVLPFIKVEKIPVTNGFVKLPDDYRNLLGAPSISLKPDGSDCLDNNPVVIDTASEFKTANLKAGCKTVPIEIVSKGEWDYRTTSTYAFPTLENPIGMFNGKQIKVCPYDLSRVELMYIKKEDTVLFKYITQPDDTYIFDPNGSVEAGWQDAAFKPLFKGILALYSAYLSDQALSNFSQVLNQTSLF